MATFYVPLVVILLLYWRIFLTARNRLRNRLAQKAAVPSQSAKAKILAKSEPTHISGPIQAVKTVTAAQMNKKNQVRLSEAGCNLHKRLKVPLSAYQA